MPTSNVDVAGKKDGYLTFVRPAGYSTRYGVVWIVKCRCGKELHMPAAEYRKKRKCKLGRPRSCGCYRKTHRSHLYRGVGDLSSCKWKQIQAGAKRKGLKFDITHDYAWRLYLRQNKCCALSGVQLIMNPSSMAAGANTASLDRKDNAKGYVRGNVQWVHLEVNDMKSNRTQKEFVEWCRLIARRMPHGG
jgi:hypothetical protein